MYLLSSVPDDIINNKKCLIAFVCYKDIYEYVWSLFEICLGLLYVWYMFDYIFDFIGDLFILKTFKFMILFYPEMIICWFYIWGLNMSLIYNLILYDIFINEPRYSFWFILVHAFDINIMYVIRIMDHYALMTFIIVSWFVPDEL